MGNWGEGTPLKNWFLDQPRRKKKHQLPFFTLRPEVDRISRIGCPKVSVRDTQGGLRENSNRRCLQTGRKSDDQQNPTVRLIQGESLKMIVDHFLPINSKW